MHFICCNYFTFIWELFQKNHEVINALVLFITLIVIIWYTIETKKLRQSNDKTLEILKENLALEKQKNDPNVIAYFDNGVNFYSVVLVLSNEGGSLAKNVRIKLTPELDFGHAVFNKYFLNNAVNNNGIDIPPKSKYVIRVGHTPQATQPYKEKKIPSNYNVEVYYTDIDKQKTFSKTFELTIDQFFNRIDPEGETNIEKQLKSINENLKKIAESLKNIK